MLLLCRAANPTKKKAKANVIPKGASADVPVVTNTDAGDASKSSREMPTATGKPGKQFSIASGTHLESVAEVDEGGLDGEQSAKQPLLENKPTLVKKNKHQLLSCFPSVDDETEEGDFNLNPTQPSTMKFEGNPLGDSVTEAPPPQPAGGMVRQTKKFALFPSIDEGSQEHTPCSPAVIKHKALAETVASTVVVDGEAAGPAVESNGDVSNAGEQADSSSDALCPVSYRPDLHIDMMALSRSSYRAPASHSNDTGDNSDFVVGYSLPADEYGTHKKKSAYLSYSKEQSISMLSSTSSAFISMNGGEGSLSVSTDIEEETADDLTVEQEITDRAIVVINRVMDKLAGLDFVDKKDGFMSSPTAGVGSSGVAQITPLGVHDQVDRLIRQASSNENLCQSFSGWCPFW